MVFTTVKDQYKAPVTITWSEVTVEDFGRLTVHRSLVKDGDEMWEQRAAISDPLQVSFTDTLDDDLPFRYRIRIEDSDGHYREAETEQIFLQTTAIVLPDEYESLQEAFDTPFIDDGDTIYANSGVYTGPYLFLDKDVCIKGVDGAHNTIIHGPRTVLVRMNRGHLNGFTVEDGSGVHLSGTARMSGCIVIKNQARTSDQSGVVAGGSSEVWDCVISSNRKAGAGDGAGMILSDSATVRNCRILRNSTPDRGGGVAVYGKPRIMNCIIDQNFGGRGGGGIFLSLYSTLEAVNCVVYKNRSGRRIGGKYGGIYSYKATLRMINSIVWGNSSLSDQSVVWRKTYYSNIQGYDKGTGNISADPRFVAPELGDFHLLPDSPCIDGGRPGNDHRDLDGSRNDMGVYGGPFGD